MPIGIPQIKEVRNAISTVIGTGRSFVDTARHQEARHWITTASFTLAKSVK
jgi:hypothetical protein